MSITSVVNGNVSSAGCCNV